MNAFNIGAMVFLIVGLCCFVYAWVFLLKRSKDPAFSWRERVSFSALILASVAAALRFVMPAFMPSSPWCKSGT